MLNTFTDIRYTNVYYNSTGNIVLILTVRINHHYNLKYTNFDDGWISINKTKNAYTLLINTFQTNRSLRSDSMADSNT